MPDKTDYSGIVPEGYRKYDLDMGYGDLLGPVYRMVENGHEWLALPIGAKHCNHYPMAHGGLLTSLADMVMGRAAVRADGLKRNCVSINLYLDFMQSAPLGSWLEAHARIDRLGKQLAFTSCELRVGSQVVAMGRSTLKFLPGNHFAKIRATQPGVSPEHNINRRGLS